MRKLILLLSLLPLWGLGGRLFAAVQVKSISADYANKRVTFALSWAAGTRNATHLSKVWVFVDYTTVTNPNTTGAWQRATVASATATAGTVSGNTGQGFYLQGTDGAFSSTVTVTLSGVPAKFNWCATATDYPPNVTATGGTYTLHGTAPFTLIAADGNSTQVVNGNSIAASALTVAPVTIRDATGCPGVFCIYTGADLYIDATHICQQRTGGAQNWEAWIKDARDNTIYKTVQSMDGTWWLAENLKYAGAGKANICNSGAFAGRFYNNDDTGYTLKTSTRFSNQWVCPAGWFIPVRNSVVSSWPGTRFSEWSGTTNRDGSACQYSLPGATGSNAWGISFCSFGFAADNSSSCYNASGHVVTGTIDTQDWSGYSNIIDALSWTAISSYGYYSIGNGWVTIGRYWTGKRGTVIRCERPQ